MFGENFNRLVRERIKARDPERHWYVLSDGGALKVASAPKADAPPAGWVQRFGSELQAVEYVAFRQERAK